MPAAALGGGASPCASGGGEKEEVGAAGSSLVHLVAVKEFNFAAARRTPPLGILRLFRQEVETLEENQAVRQVYRQEPAGRRRDRWYQARWQ